MIKPQDMTPNSIIKTLDINRDEIRKYKVKKLGLFGSFLKGSQQKKSDIDFLVLLDEPTYDNYIELKFLLEKIFHKKVDLVMEDNLKPALQYVKEEVIYAKRL